MLSGICEGEERDVAVIACQRWEVGKVGEVGVVV